MIRRRSYRRRRALLPLLFKLLLLLIILVAAGAWFAKWRVERNVSEGLDRLARQARPLGELRYVSVSAGFDGVLTVSGPSFYPERALDMPPLIGERATVRFSDFLTMVQTDAQSLPPALTASLEGLRMDFGAGERIISGNPLEALGCGGREVFDADTLEAMGIFSPQVSLTAGYELRPSQQQLLLSLIQDTGELSQLELRLELDLPAAALVDGLRMPPISNMALAGLRLIVDAQTFNQQRNAWCAEQLGVSPEAAVAANVEEAMEWVETLGWEASTTLVDQYTAFMSAEGRWLIAARPSTAIPLPELVGSEPAGLVERLDLQGSIGGAPSAGIALRPVRAAPAAVEEEATVEPPRPAARWQVMEIDALSDHLDKPVQITTQGRRYNGRLLSVTADEVHIQARLPGGSARVPIARNKISEVQIYTR